MHCWVRRTLWRRREFNCGAGPAGTSVPNAGAVNTPSNVAIPAVQSAGDPSGNVSYRSFNIKIDGGAFSPNTVIVKQGTR